MNTKKLLSLWGLKWNPFSPELPSDGLLVTAKIDHFAWRVEQLVQEGGFALITGESGTGKSVALRIVAERLARVAGCGGRRAGDGLSRRPPTSIGNWAISSRSSSTRPIVGAVSKHCANAGRPTWLPRASSRCCWWTKPRRWPQRC